MSGRSIARRPSRGTIFKHLTAGEAVGLPLAEWAHVTPRYPAGIKNSALTMADAEIQRETALFWFLSNLKIYDVSAGGPYFGFASPNLFGPLNTQMLNTAGFGQAPFAPAPIDAYQALNDEFGAVLPDALIQAIAETLSGHWMWILGASFGTVEPESKEEIQTALLEALEDLARQIRQLAPGYGQMGHNGPPDDLPVTPEEQAGTLVAIEEVKAAVSGIGEPDPVWLKKAWSRVTLVAEKLGVWALKQTDTFVTGITTEGGKAIGKNLHWLILLAIEIWMSSGRASELIEMVLRKMP